MSPGRQRIPRPPDARPGGPPPWAGWVTPAGVIGLDDVRRALSGHDPGPSPAGDDVSAAAVLVPLFEEHGQARVVLTRRASALRSHRGEVSFPGGRVDPGEDEQAAALREAEEEVGLRPDQVEVVGRLEALPTVASRFSVTPFVGLLPRRPSLTPNAAEVDVGFDVALDTLLDERLFREERWRWGADERSVYFFELEDDTVWGATARILVRLLRLVTGC